MTRAGPRAAAWVGCLLMTLPAFGCAPLPDSGCLLAAQRRLVSITLFFGRAIPGRAPLQQAEWEAFVTADLAPNFPDGFTVIDGEGRWRDPGSGRTASEPTKIVQVVEAQGADLAGRVSRVTALYRKQFNQVSVGVASAAVCAAF